MSTYTIITDSGCDLSPELLSRWGVRCVAFSSCFDDGGEAAGMCPQAFYARMRGGAVARTAAANPAAFRQVMEPELKAGKDVVYLGFSSSLSNTAAAAAGAAEELRAVYPQRRIVVCDTLCASGGLGLLVSLCVRAQVSGASLTEVSRFAALTAPRICHWFTVDELTWLKRGGRIGAATALAGTMLRVKPIMHMDAEGRLCSVHKVRGRRQAIAALAARYVQTAVDPQGIYFISHADCPDDALALEAQIAAATGRRAARITQIGPVIGAHSGPGTLALFFCGADRGAQ